jgi:hypothetical protein
VPLLPLLPLLLLLLLLLPLALGSAGPDSSALTYTAMAMGGLESRERTWRPLCSAVVPGAWKARRRDWGGVPPLACAGGEEK